MNFNWKPITGPIPQHYGYVLIALTEKGWTECEYLPEAWVSTANTIFVNANWNKGWFTHWMEIPPINT